MHVAFVCLQPPRHLPYEAGDPMQSSAPLLPTPARHTAPRGPQQQQQQSPPRFMAVQSMQRPPYANRFEQPQRQPPPPQHQQQPQQRFMQPPHSRPLGHSARQPLLRGPGPRLRPQNAHRASPPRQVVMHHERPALQTRHTVPPGGQQSPAVRPPTTQRPPAQTLQTRNGSAARVVQQP